jgi:hypothetical protein
MNAPIGARASRATTRIARAVDPLVPHPTTGNRPMEARRTEKGSRGLARGWRRGRGVGGTRNDAYRPRKKLPEPTACPECSAVWKKGRWSWARKPAGAHLHVCPACERIADGQPAGRMRLEGDFGARKDELLALVERQERIERADHPLERLMRVESKPWGISIETTGIHLARRIAEALQRTWHEAIEIRYARSEDLVRVTWRHAPPRAKTAPRRTARARS